jgi:hypothetical protein
VSITDPLLFNYLDLALFFYCILGPKGKLKYFPLFKVHYYKGGSCMIILMQGYLRADEKTLVNREGVPQ